jgi:hypothetical protein
VAGKKGLFLVIAVLVAFAIGYGQTKKRSAIQWKPSERLSARVADWHAACKGSHNFLIKLTHQKHAFPP